METICNRFPHLAERIFDQVDDQSLNNCKEISEEVLEYLENERFFWIRIIKKYGGKLKDFPDLWKPVIDKTPTEIVKEIAIAVSQFFQVRHLYSDKMQDFSGPSDNFRQNFRQGRQWSLVAISANHGDLALLQFIIKKIKLKNVRKTERTNALFLAAWQGHLEVYDFLMGKLRNKNPGTVSRINEENRTPLHYAASNGHFGTCKLIIENTSDKNPASIKYDGETPLHLAASNGHLKICKLIMEHLSDKNPANSVEDGGEFTPFHFAARKGQLAVCQLMLDNLSDKNPATKTARVTPLHIAARGGHVAVCKLIMENLVDKNPTSSSGTTPLNLATFFEKLEVCQLFHENGIHQEGREFEKLEIFKLFKSYEKDKTLSNFP